MLWWNSLFYMWRSVACSALHGPTINHKVAPGVHASRAPGKPTCDLDIVRLSHAHGRRNMGGGAAQPLKVLPPPPPNTHTSRLPSEDFQSTG